MTTPSRISGIITFVCDTTNFQHLKVQLYSLLHYVKKTQSLIMISSISNSVGIGIGGFYIGNLIGGASIFFYKYKKKVWYRSSYWCALSKRLYRRACLEELTVWRWKHTLKLRNVLFRDMLMHIVRRVTSVTLQFVGHFVWLCFKNFIPVKQFLS